MLTQRTRSLPAQPNIQETTIDYFDEAQLENAASQFSNSEPLDLVFIANGILHQDDLQPEKALRALTADNLRRIFEINTVIPALIAKHFAPRLNRKAKSDLAFMTARAGSISDNEMEVGIRIEPKKKSTEYDREKHRD